MLTMRQPRRAACCSVVSMRGWLVPGFWPMTKITSALLEVLELHRALADADRLAAAPTPLDSWHMFEQSGRLLVPNWRTNSW